VKPLRVLHVIGGDDTGGAMSYLLPLLSALERRGCGVHLLCLGEGTLAAHARQRGLGVSVLPMRGARDPRIFAPLRRILSSHAGSAQAAGRWDVVHAHGMRANIPVRLVSRSLSARPLLFTTVHSDMRLDYSSAPLLALYELAERMTMRVVDEFVCASDSLRVLLIQRGYPPAHITTIHSGLEGMEEVLAPAPGVAARSPRATGPRPLRIGTVARLVPVKDLPLLLDVAALLRESHPGLELVVVGGGPELADLQRRAARLGLVSGVRFVGRVDQVAPFLADMDVYLLTSLYEGGVPLSLLEAMAAGLPVVATAVGGVEEGVVDGVTGYLVRRTEGDGAIAAQLAERTARLLDDAGLRARMGAAGASRVREEFSVERSAAQHLHLYERCLAARRG
jgi:glycosyltransferase involved in cell wall biosynthesis